MRYPNTRYGNLNELLYYTQGLSVKDIAKQLKRSEKSVSEWLNGNRKIPFWVPELLRLRHLEADLRMRQMGFGEQKRRLGIVNGSVIDFPQPQNRANTQNPDDRTKLAFTLEIDLPTAQAPHRPSPPHSYSDDSQSLIEADQDAEAYSTHTRIFGTAP
jgi:transcriptional regulator with XRE-family HTH domain